MVSVKGAAGRAHGGYAQAYQCRGPGGERGAEAVRAGWPDLRPLPGLAAIERHLRLEAVDGGGWRELDVAGRNGDRLAPGAGRAIQAEPGHLVVKGDHRLHRTLPASPVAKLHSHGAGTVAAGWGRECQVQTSLLVADRRYWLLARDAVTTNFTSAGRAASAALTARAMSPTGTPPPAIRAPFW